MRGFGLRLAVALIGCFASCAHAQDLPVYTDTLQNGFQDYSFGGDSNFANTTPVHGGTKSIAFTGNASFNAVSFAHPTQDFATAQYSGLRLWVHGGATGNQQLRIYLQLNDAIVKHAELDTYIAGGALVMDQWREVVVNFASAPLAYSGAFDRIDLQSDLAGGQPTLYIDDVSLIAANVVNGIFADNFESIALPAGQLRFSAPVYDAIEGTSATITVERINGSSGAIAVQYATANGTATQPDDYASASGTLNWGNGDAAPRTFMVDLVDDGAAEPQESIALALSAPTGGASLGAQATAALHVTDPELLFVPQYATASIKVYRRTADGFAFVRSAPLPAGTQPNSLAFAPDGKLWVVDNGDAAKRLLRYSRQSILADANPAAEVVIGPIAGDAGDGIIGLAFFGDFAYVTQAGVNNRVLKYNLAQLGVSGNPAPALINALGLSVPAGLAFDPEGRLWVSNAGNNTLVRMNANSGTIDRTGTVVAVGDNRNSLNNPEGLAFDANGTLWVGNNGEPTISGYAAWQIEDAEDFAVSVPAAQIDVDPQSFLDGDVGGLAFDRDGDLWANYEKTASALEYQLMPMPRDGGLPGVGSYGTTAGQVLNPATTDPGFGGLAFWPSPATLHTTAQAAPFRGTNLVGMELFYGAYSQATGPIGGTNYPVFDERLIDYFAGKGITTLRFLFSWEAMQSQLFGPIPAANNGNYKAYYDNYLRIVDYATNTKNMQVIVEPWQATSASGAGGPRWRGDLVGSPQVSIAAWSDFWTKMAAILKDNPRVSFGLVNEPNQMSTMGWWTIAQAGVTAIRNSGATNRVYVPGNGYSAASTWVSGNYFNDPDPVKRSNAYGWLNANGPGQPIFDPLGNVAAEVHTYLDASQGGLGDDITSVTAARDQLAPAIDEGRARGYAVYLGEIGIYAGTPGAPAAWADFIDYFEANPDEFAGFTWWAGGDPVFWPETHAAYFSISPTSAATYTGDTVNMDMIEDFF